MSRFWTLSACISSTFFSRAASFCSEGLVHTDILSQKSIKSTGEVVPRWIQRFDQFNLLAATPILNSFFRNNRLICAGVFFNVYQAVHVVSVREAVAELTAAVFHDAAGDVIGYACIENRPSIIAENIDEKTTHIHICAAELSHTVSLKRRWLSNPRDFSDFDTTLELKSSGPLAFARGDAVQQTVTSRQSREVPRIS